MLPLPNSRVRCANCFKEQLVLVVLEVASILRWRTGDGLGNRNSLGMMHFGWCHGDGMVTIGMVAITTNITVMMVVVVVVEVMLGSLYLPLSVESSRTAQPRHSLYPLATSRHLLGCVSQWLSTNNHPKMTGHTAGLQPFFLTFSPRHKSWD